MQKPLAIGNHTKPRKTGIVLATELVWGSMGCLRGCILEWCTGVRPLSLTLSVAPLCSHFSTFSILSC